MPMILEQERRVVDSRPYSCHSLCLLCLFCIFIYINMEEYLYLLWGFVILIVLFALSILAMLIYCGLFTPINVETSKPPIGSCYLAYKDGAGPYSNVGYVFTESTSIAPSFTQMGIYYDNPAKVSGDKLRWVVACILAESESKADAKVRAAYEKENYKFMTLPAVNTSVNCVFPYINMISIFIAVGRVYPALASYVTKRKLEAYPIIEVYKDGYIHFMAPLTSQMEFYSPTALETEKASPVKQDQVTQKPEDQVPQKDDVIPINEAPDAPTSEDEDPTNLAPREEDPTTLAPREEDPTTLAPREELPTTLAPREESSSPVSVPPSPPAPAVEPLVESSDSDCSFEKIDAENI